MSNSMWKRLREYIHQNHLIGASICVNEADYNELLENNGQLNMKVIRSMTAKTLEEALTTKFCENYLLVDNRITVGEWKILPDSSLKRA